MTGLVLSLLLSGICIAFVQTYAPWIGSVLLEDARTVSLLRLMTFSLPFACIHSCINGYYFGKKKAAIPSISQLLEQLIRVAGVWLLIQILTEQGNLPSPEIAVWGILVRGSDRCALFRYDVTFFHTQKNPTQASLSLPPESRSYLQVLRELCTMTLPLTCNRILLSICQSAEAILIPMKLRDFGYTNSDALSVYGILTGMDFFHHPVSLRAEQFPVRYAAACHFGSKQPQPHGSDQKSSPEDDTIVCHPWTAVYSRFSARRKLDRHSPVPQCFGRTLCPDFKLDLSVSVPRNYAVQHSAWSWETDTHNADQLVRSHTPHWLYFCWYSTDRSVCLSMGYACQSDFDLRSGTYQPA